MTWSVTMMEDGGVVGIIEIPEAIPEFVDLPGKVMDEYGRMLRLIESEGIEEMPSGDVVERFVRHLASNRVPARSVKVIGISMD